MNLQRRKAQTRKKLVATASRHESVYNRTDEPSVTFHERGGTTVRVMDFCSNKNRERSNPFRCGKSGQFRYFPFHQATAGLPKDHACFGYVLVNADITPPLRYQPFLEAKQLPDGMGDI